MALLHCRDCGADLKSDTRQTRCKQCGTLFPCACQVCDRPLRPPFPVYEDERYLTSADEPLCEEHYQRLCPSCHKWFQADENPGYFLCLNCSKQRSAAVTAAVAVPSVEEGEEVEAEAPVRRRRPKPTSWGCLAGMALVGIFAIYGVISLLWALVDMVTKH